MEKSGTSGEGRGLAAGLQVLTAVFLSVVLYVLAFPSFNLAETAYVFAVPLVVYGLFCKQGRHERLILFLGGWIAWIVLIFWLRNFTSHLSIPFNRTLGWLAMLALSAILGFFWALWAWLACILSRASRERSLVGRLGVLVLLSGAWVVLEWVRGVLFSGFPWLPLSTSQWQRPLILQIASLTGGYGVSFVLIAFNVGLAYYLHSLWHNRRATWWRRLSPEFYAGLICLFFAIGFGLYSSGLGTRERLAGPRLGFVQPDAGAVEKWDLALMEENLALLKDLSTYATFLGSELILWPESPTPLPVKGNASMQEWVESLCRQLDTPLLIGNVAREGDPDDPERKWYNAVFLVDPLEGVALESYYAKRHLVPFGEYVPLSGMLPFIRKVVPVEGEFHAGKEAAPLVFQMTDEDQQIGVLICYEDIFPALARSNARKGADWHYVATNNVWYGEEAGAYQHAAHSVLRAVETRRPVVRCGNAGWSGWIDEYGHIRHVMRDDSGSIYFQGVEAVDFSMSRYWHVRLSGYVKYGDWFVGVSAFLVALGLVALKLAGPRLQPEPAARRRRLMGGLRGGRNRA